MENRKVIKNSIIYTFSNILIKAFNFLLLPLYTAYLTTADYGASDLVKTFAATLNLIIAVCMYSAVSRFYTDVRNDKEKKKELFGNLVTFVALSAIFWCIVLITFKSFFIKTFFYDIPFFPTVLIGIVGMAFNCLYTMYQSILKAMEDAGKSAITSISYFIINVLFSVILIVILKKGANGVLLAKLIADFIGCIFMFYDLIKRDLISFGIKWSVIEELLRYSIPLLPHNLSTYISQLVSRMLLNRTYSLSSVGIYSIASQFGTLADIILVSVAMAFEPWFFRLMKNRDDAKTKQIMNIAQTLVWIYGAIFIGISLFSQEVLLLVLDKTYWEAWTIVPFIIMVFTIKIIYYFYVEVLFFHKSATKFIFIGTVIGSVVNIILATILIPRWDMYGAACADILAMIVRVIIVVIISLKVEDIGYSLKTFISKIILIIAISLVGNIFSYYRFIYTLSWENFGFKCVVYTSYLIVVGFYVIKQKSFIEIVDKYLLNKFRSSYNDK